MKTTAPPRSSLTGARAAAEIAARVAADIPDGAVVNLGIGLPTLVANHLPPANEIILHSENGILGMGPQPAPGEADPDLINAGKQPVTLRPGGCFFHHADSFAMIRGRHIDLCVLGAFQVAANGDLANWSTADSHAVPAVGGAMDLAVGARRVVVAMEHTTKRGEPKLLARCTLPLTASACIVRVYTDLGTFDPIGTGFRVVDLASGWSHDAIQALTGAPLVATP
jgi:3-oxoadipate CoA-transferase beta subunit